jgi:hypothetical protein
VLREKNIIVNYHRVDQFLVQLEIIDNGVGITPEQISSITQTNEKPLSTQMIILAVYGNQLLIDTCTNEGEYYEYALMLNEKGIIATVGHFVDECSYFTRVKLIAVDQEDKSSNLWVILNSYSLMFPEVNFEFNANDKVLKIENKFLSRPNDDEIILNIAQQLKLGDIVHTTIVSDLVTIYIIGSTKDSKMEIYEYMQGKIFREHISDRVIKHQLFKKFGISLVNNSQWCENIRKVDIKSDIVILSFFIVLQ